MNQDQIISILCNYPNCRSLIISPIALPCCGESICEAHLQDDIYVDKSRKFLECPFCKQKIKIPIGGLSVNKILKNLIYIDLGPEHVRAKKNYNRLTDHYASYLKIQNRPNEYFEEYFNLLTTNVEKCRRDWKDIVYNYHEDLRNQINTHKTEAESKLRTDNEDPKSGFLDELKEIVDDAENSKLNLKKKAELELKIDNLKNKIQDRIKNFHLYFLNNRNIKFNTPSADDYEMSNTFGKLLIINPEKKFKMITASTDAQIKLWDLSNGTCIKTYANQISVSSCIFLSPYKIAFCHNYERTVKVRNCETDERIQILDYYREPRKLVRFSENKYFCLFDCGSVYCIDLEDNYIIKVFQLDISTNGDIDFYYIEEKKQMVCYADRLLRIWDLNTFECIVESCIPGDFNVMKVYSISPQIFICGSRSGDIYSYDLKDSQSVFLFKAYDSPVLSLALLRDNKLATSTHSTVSIWDLNTFTCLGTINDNEQTPIYGLRSLSLDLLVGCVNRIIKIWNYESLDLVYSLAGHTGRICDFDIIEIDNVP